MSRTNKLLRINRLIILEEQLNPHLERLKQISNKERLFERKLTPARMERLIYWTSDQRYDWEFEKEIKNLPRIIREEIKQRAIDLLPGTRITYHQPKIDETSTCSFKIGRMSVKELLERGFDKAYSSHPEIYFDERIFRGDDRFEPIIKPYCIKVEREGRSYNVQVLNPAKEIFRRSCWGRWSGGELQYFDVQREEVRNQLNLENADWARQLQEEIVRFTKNL